jgi:hypothetical protein
VKALLKLERAHGFAKTMGGERVELAGTAIGAVAINELGGLDFPGGHYVLIQFAQGMSALPPIADML